MAYNRRSVAYISLIILLGVIQLAAELYRWRCQDWPRFWLYLGAALVASLLKVSLPGLTSTVSVQFIIILIAIISLLPLPETLLIGAATIVVQRVWHSKSRTKAIQLLFNVAGIIITISITATVYRLGLQFQERMGLSVILAVTSLTFFAMNTLPVSVAIALTEGKRLIRTWKECSLWSFPIFVLGAIIAGVIATAQRSAILGVCAVFIPSVYVVYLGFHRYLLQLSGEKSKAEEAGALHLRTIEALALAIEARDDANSEELLRVQAFSVELGKRLGLNDESLRALRTAALLRDIGKLGVPQHILLKKGHLTPAEFDRLKIHPIISAEILEWVEFPYSVASIVLAHHEKWDGTGYPHGLKGNTIPLASRILCVADSLNALMSPRQYRSGIPLREAVSRIASEAGTTFDPQVVEVLREQCDDLEKLTPSARSSNREVSAKLRDEYRRAHASESSEPSPAPHVVETISSIASASRELLLNADPSGWSFTLKESLAAFAIRLQPVVAYDAITVYIQRGKKLIPEYASVEDSLLLSSLELPFGVGLAGRVAETHKAILNGDPAVEAARINNADQPRILRSALSVPLEAADGTLGVLTLYRKQKDAFTKDELRVLLGLRLRVVNSQWHEMDQRIEAVEQIGLLA